MRAKWEVKARIGAYHTEKAGISPAMRRIVGV